MTELIKRLIPVLFIKNGLIVRSQGFSRHQVIGNVIDQAKRLNEWDADELVYIDISREASYDLGRDDLKVESMTDIETIISEIGKICFMPLTFGGGIKNVNDAIIRIRSGADKITINTLIHKDTNIVKEIISILGSQAVVASVDYSLDKDTGVPYVFINNGKLKTNINLFDFVSQIEDLGIGEIFMQNIDFDGKAQGYNIEVISKAVDILSIPVIACSGAGKPEHFVEVAKIPKLSAIAAGNYFNFKELSYPSIKKELRESNLNVR